MRLKLSISIAVFVMTIFGYQPQVLADALDRAVQEHARAVVGELHQATGTQAATPVQLFSAIPASSLPTSRAVIGHLAPAAVAPTAVVAPVATTTTTTTGTATTASTTAATTTTATDTHASGATTTRMGSCDGLGNCTLDAPTNGPVDIAGFLGLNNGVAALSNELRNDPVAAANAAANQAAINAQNISNQAVQGAVHNVTQSIQVSVGAVH